MVIVPTNRTARGFYYLMLLLPSKKPFIAPISLSLSLSLCVCVCVCVPVCACVCVCVCVCVVRTQELRCREEELKRAALEQKSHEDFLRQREQQLAQWEQDVFEREL